MSGAKRGSVRRVALTGHVSAQARLLPACGLAMAKSHPVGQLHPSGIALRKWGKNFSYARWVRQKSNAQVDCGYC